MARTDVLAWQTADELVSRDTLELSESQAIEAKEMDEAVALILILAEA